MIRTMKLTKAIDVLILVIALASSYVILDFALMMPNGGVFYIYLFLLLPAIIFLVFRYRYRDQLSSPKLVMNAKRALWAMALGYALMVIFLKFCANFFCAFVGEFGYVISAVATVVFIAQLIVL
jgi:hypothetical protein